MSCDEQFLTCAHAADAELKACAADEACQDEAYTKVIGCVIWFFECAGQCGD